MCCDGLDMFRSIIGQRVPVQDRQLGTADSTHETITVVEEEAIRLMGSGSSRNSPSRWQTGFI